MESLDDFAAAKLETLEAQHLKRVLRPTHRRDGVMVERDGRRYVSFSCNDYLGLSRHPAVKSAAVAAVECFGAGAGASRLITGDYPLLSALETRLAARKGKAAACVFGSGYLANAGLLPTFVGAGDLILLDELAHASLWAGARLSGAQTSTFRHNDANDLTRQLAERRSDVRRVLVATESVFSMDGDIAPLDAISECCQTFGAWLLVDDAHGFGVLGGGLGAGAHFPDAKVDLTMGTLSKAIGSYGAYVCASQSAIDLVRTRARTFIYTTGLPPPSAGAALAALDVIAAEPERCGAPLARAKRFTGAAALPPAETPIVPVLLGTAERALAAAADLERAGLLAVAIRPPTVPAGGARLRLAFSALHTDEQVDLLASTLRPWLAA